MNILFILVPVSLILGAIWLVGFIWALRRDQFEDLEGDARRILFDDHDDAPIADEDAPRWRDDGAPPHGNDTPKA